MHISLPRTAPTRREIIIVVILLAALLIVSQWTFDLRPHLFPATPKETGYPVGGTHIPYPPPVPTYAPTDAQRTRLDWGDAQVPQTKIVAHVPGWTIIDNLYILNGTMFIVTDQLDLVPDRKYMTSTGIPIENGAEAIAERLPTDKEMRIVSTHQAKELFGPGANIIDGVTWLTNDNAQFVTHYYHWSAELFFGFWRTYSSLDPHITPNGSTTLPPPRRMSFVNLDGAHWRDYAHMNQWVLRASFPGISMEFSADWKDRAEMAHPFVFDRVVLADRSAAMHGFNYARTQRTASEPFALPGSAHWWRTIRNNVVMSTKLRADIGHGTVGRPVITYVSRQEWGRRMLIPEDHEKLVRELYKLRDEFGYEVNVVSMDKLSRVQQLQLAARTTILIGVHGNGLTALVWMNPNPRSTVMEFFFPGGFAHDYEYTTRALGMVHYGFWGSQYFTSPQTPPPDYPEGFQGNSIPLDGEVVARLIHARLTLSAESDD